MSAGSSVLTGSPRTGGLRAIETRSPGSSASEERATHRPWRSAVTREAGLASARISSVLRMRLLTTVASKTMSMSKVKSE